MKSISRKVFCAFCRLERKVYTKKSLSWTNVLLAFFSALVVMYAFWQRMDGRVAIIFVLFVCSAEVFVRLRWRMSLQCPHCKFDPVVYKRSKYDAMIKVRDHLTSLRASGKYLLKHNNPFENLPVVRIDPETQEKTIS